jgi:hypothetical protein
MAKMSREPLVKLESKISSVKLTGWENERGISWNLSKRYKDKETGEWKESKYLTDWDLDALVSLAAQAKEFLSERRKASKQEGGAPPPTPIIGSDYKFEDDKIPF